MEKPEELPPHYSVDERPFPGAYGGYESHAATTSSTTYVVGQPGVAIYQPNPMNLTTTVILAQPVRQNAIPMAGEGREWKHKLSDCCDSCGVCALGYFCPWIMMCCILNSIGELTYCTCAAGNGSAALMARIKIRTALGIKGSFCGDVCCTQCCFQCVACQMYKELKDVGALKENCCYCGCDRDKQCLCE